MKYIIVTGGVVSGLGKGITISSIGVLLKASGLRVTSIKIDPYLNSDAGTMSPFEHGEVYVLDDGGEVDLDLGNYERFLRVKLTKDHNITTGKVYRQVINRERRGDYLGRTVQVVPHVTDAIQDWIERIAHISTDEFRGSPDVCLVEVGGTVGDIESMVFLEALRQFQFRVGKENFCLVHVSLVPVLGSVGEQKTKPTQHGVKELRSVGLSPDVIVCRSDKPLEESTKAKIASFCHVERKSVVAVHNLPNIYHVPLYLEEQGLTGILCSHLQIEPSHAPPALERWSKLANDYDAPTKSAVKIAIVGKYTGLSDSYLSVIKALTHAGIGSSRKIDIVWIEAATLEGLTDEELANSPLGSVDGVVLPGGFGDRGFQGKIETAKYCRTNKIPFLGICLGMHAVVVEYARNVLNLPNAHSQEFQETADPCAIVFMPEISTTDMGGTMRLGSRTTRLYPVVGEEGHSISQEIYGNPLGVNERHRHRYEVNPELLEKFETNGLFFTGKDERGQRMECAEVSRSEHPFYWCCQYHPEFQSYPHSPSPPFLALVEAAAGDLVLPYKLDMERAAADLSAEIAAAAVATSPFPSPAKLPANGVLTEMSLESAKSLDLEARESKKTNAADDGDAE